MQNQVGGARHLRRGAMAVVVMGGLGLASPAPAQQARALVAPYLQIPPGIRFSEVDPRTFGARAAEVAALEAFTLPDLDSRTVFINVDRPLFRLAARDGEAARFHRAMLASIVAHELLHLRGERSEVAALREERRVWLRFVRDHLVPTDLGMQRAALMDQEIRRAEGLTRMAGRGPNE
jgi:hypothetical protein